MLYVPVVSNIGKPLMPCHPARARELVRKGRAVRRFNRGLFYIQLLDRADGETQDIAVGIDPGSKKEGFTIKSESHTYLNIQADAVTWVSDAIKTRREMRRGRRFRKVPCRPNRHNRMRGSIPPSTLARWQWKLRIACWLAKFYPIATFVVEDIRALTTGRRRWDASFSPLEIGKQWFYQQIGKIARVITKAGWETKELRTAYGLRKTNNKTDDVFEAHCVDAWVLANWWTGGHTSPDNIRLLRMVPLHFHRRQLHRLQPEKGGKRKPYGSTRSLGFKRGSLVKHPKWGVVYVGGQSGNCISLHAIADGKRLCQTARPSDCEFLAFNMWRTMLLPMHRGEDIHAIEVA